MKKRVITLLLVGILVCMFASTVSAKFLELYVGSFWQKLQAQSSVLAQVDLQMWALKNGYVLAPEFWFENKATVMSVNGTKGSGDLGTVDIDNGLDYIHVSYVEDFDPNNIGVKVIIEQTEIHIPQDSTATYFEDQIWAAMRPLVTGSDEYCQILVDSIYCDLNGIIEVEPISAPY